MLLVSSSTGEAILLTFGTYGVSLTVLALYDACSCYVLI